MRRRILLLLTILLASAGVAVAAFGPPSSGPHTLRVVYVQRGELPLGQPQSTALTIQSTPNPSTAGRAVTITGQAFGTPSAALKVQLWTKLSGQVRFHSTETTRTDAQGDYSFALPQGAVDT